MYSIKWADGSKRKLPEGFSEVVYLKSINRSVGHIDDGSVLQVLESDSNVIRVDDEPEEEVEPPEDYALIKGFDGAVEGESYDSLSSSIDAHWKASSDDLRTQWEENSGANVTVEGIDDGYSDSAVAVTLVATDGNFRLESPNDNLSDNEFFVRFYFRISGYTGGRDTYTELITEEEAFGDEFNFKCVLNDDGTVELTSINGSLDSSTATLPTGQWIRIEAKSNRQDQEDRIVRFWWTDPESEGTPDIELSHTNTQNWATIRRLLPIYTTTSSIGHTIDFDEFILSEWDWIGPRTNRNMFSESVSSGQQVVGIDDAWNITTGDPNMIIAVLDTGVNSSEILPESRIRRDIGRDYITEGDDSNTYDRGNGHWINDHGTKAASVMAGNGRINGVIPQCQIAPFPIYYPVPGESSVGSAASVGIPLALERCLEYDIKICFVNYISAGNSTLEDAVNNAHENGMLIFGAGSYGSHHDPGYPGDYETALSVNVHDESYDAVNTDNIPDNISSLTGQNGMLGCGDVRSIGGTSGSTPMATGIAALIWSAYTSFTRDEIKQKLLETAIPDGRTDYGGLNATAAIAAALPAPQNVQILSSDPSEITIGWDAVAGADSYTVEKDGVIVAEHINDTQYTDTNPQYAFNPKYRIRAVTGA